ncbi:FitA-like ribbon-helix-helix domain-containing protein [Thiocystis violacea]|uniref:FitA-like ribbon-helix-helix domain-containing protein n=1 Tax=Thiocystis violacea TaxID=13725 RepID=UPI001904C804|nr:hypothetical protein [Thiocystis violacea]MBK1725036.1 hypothetical protein [Thiocystis violacea]
MPSLTLKDIPIPLMERLRTRAAQDQRSLNREAIWLLEQALEPSVDPSVRLQQETEAQLAAWQALAGRWQGDAEATAALIEDIYQARTPGREFSL